MKLQFAEACGNGELGAHVHSRAIELCVKAGRQVVGDPEAMTRHQRWLTVAEALGTEVAAHEPESISVLRQARREHTRGGVVARLQTLLATECIPQDVTRRPAPVMGEILVSWNSPASIEDGEPARR